MAKDSVTIRLQSDLIDRLDEEADDRDQSRSGYIRDIIESRDDVEDLQERVDYLEDRLESREDRIDQLEEQLAKRQQIEEKVDVLAKKQDESNAPFFVQWYSWIKDR